MPIFRRSTLTSTFAPGQHLTVDDDRPLVDVLEQVDAAEERRLPGARRADQADDLVEIDGEVDPVQHLELAEALGDVLERDEVAVRRRSHAPRARSRRSRCLMMWSVKRASGIVRMMKKTAATVNPA